MADLPTDRQLHLVHACGLHLRTLALWQVGLQHDEGVSDEYCQGFTGPRTNQKDGSTADFFERNSASPKFRVQLRRRSGALLAIL